MKSTHNKSPLFALMALVIVASMVLAACGGPAAEAPTSAETAPAALEVPAQPQSDVILEENFADNSNNWDIGSKESSESVIEDGKLKVKSQIPAEGYSHTFFTPPVSAENVDISVDIEFSDGAPENGVAGVVCQYKDDDNYIWVAINRDWGYTIQKQVNKEWTTLVRWTISALIHQESGVANHLRVVCNDGHIALFINDGLVADTVDTSLSGGSFRLDAASRAENMDDTTPISMSFSNLVAHEPQAWEAPAGILLSDSFDNNSNAWNIYDKDEYGRSSQIQDGQLILRFENENSNVEKGLPVQVSNVDMSFDATIKEGALSDASYGATCRKTYSGDQSSYYEFEINNGGYRLEKNTAGAWETMVDWTNSTAIKSGIGETNRVRVVCSGSTLELYANDQLLISMQDESFVSGYSAIAARRYKDDNAIVSVTFDNLEMSYALPPSSESFDNNDNEWQLNEDETGSVQIKDGQLVIAVNKQSTWQWAVQNAPSSDMDISFDATLLEGTQHNAGYGVACRLSEDGNNYYDFIVSSNGVYGLFKMVDGNYETLIEYSESKAMKTGAGVINRFRVVCSGSNLGLYANGQEVFMIQDKSITTGDFFALEAGMYQVDDTPILVTFDNVAVK